MRWVDIDSLLELPDGWLESANKALNDIRQEIANAEKIAHLNGNDVKTARRVAIKKGLKDRERIWQALKPSLAAIMGDKCWYSECTNPGSDKDVDHFRPKKSVIEDPDHEGYWWLAFDWRNYRFSCAWSNKWRNKNGDAGGKQDHFPLCKGSFRARFENDDIEREDPELLDPTNPEDCALLTFRVDGHPVPTKESGKDHNRAETSIVLYHLDCREMVSERRELAREIQQLIQSLDRLQPHIVNNLVCKNQYKDIEKQLLRKFKRKAEYSSAAFAFALFETITLVRGTQVKREWLIDLLSRPH